MTRLPYAGDAAYGNNKSIKILIMKKDNKTMKHAYVKITDDKMAEMEDVLRKMGNLDEIDPKVIVHELIRKVFGVSFNEVVAKDSFSGRYNKIASFAASYIKNKISLGGPVLVGRYLDRASSDGGFCGGCVVREEVKNGVIQFWFAEGYDLCYDYNKDRDGIASGPYGLGDLNLFDVIRAIAFTDRDAEKCRDEITKLINDAFSVLDAMTDAVFLENPFMVCVDKDGKWCNEIIYRIYKRRIHSSKESYCLSDSCDISYAELMRIVDAVLGSKR